MKYVKMLSLAAVTTAVLMAFVGASTASATTLTGVGGSVLKAGSTIHANNVGTSVITTSFKNIECTGSTIQGTTSNETGATVNVTVSALTFTGCNCEVKVISGGSLAIASSGGGNGSVSSSGAEVTTTCSTIFGTVHCIYVTSNGPWATLTGSRSLNNLTARLDVTVNFPRLATSGLCSEVGTWHVEFSIDNPDWLDVS